MRGQLGSSWACIPTPPPLSDSETLPFMVKILPLASESDHEDTTLLLDWIQTRPLDSNVLSKQPSTLPLPGGGGDYGYLPAARTQPSAS